MTDQASRKRDRPTSNPGGMSCENCGCTFIGDPDHKFCGVCVEAVAKELAAEQRKHSVTSNGQSILERLKLALDEPQRINESAPDFRVLLLDAVKEIESGADQIISQHLRETRLRAALLGLVTANPIERGSSQDMNASVPYTSCRCCRAGDAWRHIPDDEIRHKPGCAYVFAVAALRGGPETGLNDCLACSVGNPGVYIKDGRMVCPHRPE